MPDGEGGIVEVDIQEPVWVEPAKVGTDANMLGAFQLAKGIAQKWMKNNPQYPAPMIVNISGGMPHYGGKQVHECMKETTVLAKEIMSLSNEDGNVLVCNVHIDKSRSDTIVFPDDRNKLKQEEAQFLFDISSEVPASFFSFINKSYPCGIQESCGVGSRCYVCNLTPSNLISLIPSFDYGS